MSALGCTQSPHNTRAMPGRLVRRSVQGAGPGGRPVTCPSLRAPTLIPRQHPRDTGEPRGLHSFHTAPGRPFWGPTPLPPPFFCFFASLSSPVMELAHSGWASLLGPGGSHEGLSWVLVGTQAAYSSLSTVLAPSLTLSVTPIRLWKRNKELPGPGGAQEFRGQAPAGLSCLDRPGGNTEGLCNLNRHPCPFKRLPPRWQEHTTEAPFHPKVFQPVRGPDSDCPLGSGVERRRGHGLRADPPFLEDPRIHHTSLKGKRSPPMAFWR